MINNFFFSKFIDYNIKNMPKYRDKLIDSSQGKNHESMFFLDPAKWAIGFLC